ncbi:hypothetical protein TB1_014347 [Malus domestica]
MCVDYTDLNKGCQKGSFPLSLIGRLIDSTVGCELLSFMDAYSEYNQILMNPPDQEHTAFTTDRGLYCYKVMPFGLKNAGATYQRLVNSIFTEQIGKNMEVYVDDMLVKSKHADKHIVNLSETFTILKRYRMRLNSNKCAFDVGSGKLLGFMISQRGIEANPEKIKTILDMKEPVTLKDIKSLTGKVAVLTRVISKATDRCAPFFKALKGSKKYITWTDECAEAFKNLKDYMSEAHLLSKPEGYEAGLVLTTPDKVAIEYALRFKFKASNNEAEYEALIAGLRLAKHLGVTNNFDDKDSSMTAYVAQTQLLLKHFHYQITQIPRAANSHADVLARLALAVEDKIGRKIQIELLAAPSTMAAEVCNLQHGDNWITSIYKFFAHGTLPNDKVQAKQI